MQSFYVPDFVVKIQGLTLEADVTRAILDLTYDNNIETADMFTLRLNNANQQFTDSALFDVGKTVELYMGYVNDLQPMMLGEIVAISPSFPQSGAPALTLTAYDKSHRLRHNTPQRTTFKFMNDSLIAAQIAAENLLIPVVDPAPMPPRCSVQQGGSDWTLLKEMADRNFFQVFVHWDKLYFRFPRPQTELVVLEWGKNLISFNPRLSTSRQVGIQEIRGYNQELAQQIVAILPVIALGNDLDNLIEQLGSTFVEQLVSFGKRVIHQPNLENPIEAAVLAKSVLKQLLQGLYEGSGSCMGLPTLRAGDMIEIRGVGKRFSGKYTLSRVTHTINQGGYLTQFEVSQQYHTNLLQSLRNNIAETPSPNRQESIRGVVVGEVKNNLDPQGLGRVQISLPHLCDANLSCWAAIATLDKGTYFLPDVGDQVLVAFDRGDINKPYVLGALWNITNNPPDRNAGMNEKKVIRTKSGMQILLDETPGNEKLVLQDKSGSAITMASSSGNIIIEAKGDVVIKSGPGQKIDLNP
ncbi:phage baseplate assembly protein V [Nostoc sp. UIC 10607]|uniref:phage baseplate assembly protein V n=1 Tax=Nostoc sp. UIC 10607 TaxID=3045935 RepID=UPI0039A0BB4F